MRKIFYIFVALGILSVVFFIVFPKTQKKEEKTLPLVKIIPTKPVTPKNYFSIFVPYWADMTDLGKEGDKYNRYIYFGVDANVYGINSGPRIQNLKQFIQQTPENKEKWLTVTMTNTDVNIEVLKNNNSWEKIFSQTVNLAKENGFSGIVLDLEMSVLPFENVVTEINDFVGGFANTIRKNNIKVALSIYGDTFYKHRPYDLKTLSKYADEIMVMAYDFHKSRGEPGPNFPFDKDNIYDYDFKTMVGDFLLFVPADHLTVVFGEFGYDWPVDEKKRPITAAKSLTLNEIKKKFIDKCKWENCIVRRDTVSAETEVNYIFSVVRDNVGYMDMHIVWFEDERSTQIKQEFLKSKGVGSMGYWAYGYF